MVNGCPLTTNLTAAGVAVIPAKTAESSVRFSSTVAASHIRPMFGERIAAFTCRQSLTARPPMAAFISAVSSSIAESNSARGCLVAEDEGGLEATTEICSRSSRALVLMLSQYNDEENVIAGKSAGAWGLMTKQSASSRLVDAVRAAGRGSLEPDHQTITAPIPVGR